MKRSWLAVLGMVHVVLWSVPTGAAPPLAADAADDAPVAAPADAGDVDTEPAPPPEAEDGHAIIDTEASARREAEFRRVPLLPQVFIHQWHYREPAVPVPDASGADREIARMTLAEAVHAALEHNPGVSAQRLTPLRQREDVRQAESVFDPILSGFTGKDRKVAPSGTALGGAQIVENQNFDANLALAKTLRTGADFRIDFTNNRFKSNSTFQGLLPQYKPELVFSLNQPLLRNFGANFAYLLVDIASISSEASRWTYRAQLADFTKRVIVAYWAVVFARQNLAVQEQSLELARRTLAENQERVRVGLLAPVAVKEAEAQAALREEQVIVAANLLDNTRRTLQQTVYMQTGQSLVPRAIEPVEEPRTAPVAVDGDAALAIALEQRPEIQAQNLDLRSKNLTARVRENQLLPRVDFVGNVGLNGLGGDAVPVQFQGQTVFSQFGGSYGKALDRLTSGDFYSYLAGVEVEIPIGNAAAKAQYTQAKIDVSQSELNRRQLLADITLEVGQAATDVAANVKRIRSARLARELAEENLRNQEKRLEVGIATTKDVLDFQDDLTQARGLEVRAATDYNISLAELARAQGTLLDRYSVVVEVPGKRFVPWWAKF